MCVCCSSHGNSYSSKWHAFRPNILKSVERLWNILKYRRLSITSMQARQGVISHLPYKARLMSIDLYTSSQILFVSRLRRSGCNPTRSMNNTHVLQQTIRKQQRGVSNSRIADDLQVSPWTLDMEYSLAADTRRIFNALTVPEYIEAWICVPGYHPDCQNVTCRVAHGFQIEHRCHSGAITRITGTYFSFLKRKLSFSWRPAGASGAGDSLVDIRLRGDFERSILRLRHRGFESEEEFNWHDALWSASIARLSRLFDKPTMGTNHHRLRDQRQRSELFFEL